LEFKEMDESFHETPVQSIELYSIGHSNHTIDEFLELLKHYGIRSLIDVRRQPHSSKFAQFDWKALEYSLLHHEITYHWFEDLGGWRKGLGEESPNLGLKDGGMRHYADYMLSDAFRAAVGRLIGIVRIRQTAIMCAEKHVQHCHRYLLSDYLTAQGMAVTHILDQVKHSTHELTRSAEWVEGRGLLYPGHPDEQGTLFHFMK
jgi:uncharacterized protein (DUF488 family)